MTGRVNEVNTSMDTVVDDVTTIDLVFGLEVSVEARFDVIDNRTPRLVIVDKVTKTRRVDDRQLEANAILFNIGADGFNTGRLGKNIVTRTRILLRWIKAGAEECVH